MEEKLLVPIRGRIRRLDPHDVATMNSLKSCILETQQIAWERANTKKKYIPEPRRDSSLIVTA